MSSLPVRQRPGIMTRIVVGMLRALRFTEPDTFQAGADFATDSPAVQSYPTMNSMAAMSAFPWVRACVLAKADDLSGLSIKVMRNGAEVENHPVTAIISRPATRTTWREWIRQAVVDYELAGNHYSLIQGGQSLLRMHPNRTEPVPQSDGQIQGYQYQGSVNYEWEDVLHVRNASWSDSIEAIVGEGSIRALHADLTADLAAKKMTADAAKRGRLEGVFSPQDGDLSNWGDAIVKRVKEAVSRWSSEGSGYLILGSGVKFDSVSATPRDLEFSEQRSDTRDATLATFSVPPARLSLPTANFATQQQQMKTYWESLRGGPAAALADALTWLARRVGEANDVVVFDFSEVEALQESRTERLSRVQMHIMNGIDAVAAYEMEGIEVPEDAFVVFAPEPAVEEEPEEQNEEETKALPRTENERADTWRNFIDSVHAPSERDLHLATMRYLRDAVRRYAKRIEEVAGRTDEQRGITTKALSNEQILAILAVAEEEAAIVKALRLPMRSALVRAFRAAALRMGARLVFDPTLANLEEKTRSTAIFMASTQGNVIRSILAGLSEGQSVNDVQNTLLRSYGFSARRSLQIARTEATRFVNAGAEQAYGQAAADGLPVKKQWLTARDGEVRAAHRTLDGQTVEVGEEFHTATGEGARYPGGFGSAALDANCRCTLIPVLE